MFSGTRENSFSFAAFTTNNIMGGRVGTNKTHYSELLGLTLRSGVLLTICLCVCKTGLVGGPRAKRNLL